MELNVYESQDAAIVEMNKEGNAAMVRLVWWTWKASERRPFQEGRQVALVKIVVIPVDAWKNSLCPLAVHPFCYRAVGLIEESALRFRFWVGGFKKHKD